MIKYGSASAKNLSSRVSYAPRAQVKEGPPIPARLLEKRDVPQEERSIKVERTMTPPQANWRERFIALLFAYRLAIDEEDSNGMIKLQRKIENFIPQTLSELLDEVEGVIPDELPNTKTEERLGADYIRGYNEAMWKMVNSLIALREKWFEKQ